MNSGYLVSSKSAPFVSRGNKAFLFVRELAVGFGVALQVLMFYSGMLAGDSKIHSD